MLLPLLKSEHSNATDSKGYDQRKPAKLPMELGGGKGEESVVVLGATGNGIYQKNLGGGKELTESWAVHEIPKRNSHKRINKISRNSL